MIKQHRVRVVNASSLTVSLVTGEKKLSVPEP